MKRDCLRSGKNRSLYVPNYRKKDETEYHNYRGLSLLSTTYKMYPTLCCQYGLHMQKKLLGIISGDFDATAQLLILYSAFVKYSGRIGIKCSRASALYRLLERAIVYNIIIESSMPIKLVRLIKVCLKPLTQSG